MPIHVDRYFRILLLFWIALAEMNAAPLRNVPQVLVQPNGDTLRCFASGDEYYNWLHDKDQYTIIQDHRRGYYTYAVMEHGELVPSMYIAGTVDPRAVGLLPGANITSERAAEERHLLKQKEISSVIVPHTGTINNLTVFIRFSDDSEFTDPISIYNGMFNGSSPTSNSLYKYYLEVSYNKLSITSTFYPIPPGTTVVSYQDQYPRSYYQPYDSITNPNGYKGGSKGAERAAREQLLLANALNTIASQVSTSLNLDTNNDGYVDNISFITYGSPTAWSSLLWPHRRYLDAQEVYINGKRAWTYDFHLQADLVVGVLAHEMFHSLGAPDLYHKSYDGLKPVDRWDLMENDLDPPQHMGAYMKWRYGTWIDAIPTISANGTYALNPLISSTNNCYKIVSPNSATEYFVLEYRKREGKFESSLPTEGLLVYRINTAMDGLGNGEAPPDEVYVYRPGGMPRLNGSPNDAPFSSNVGRSRINDDGNPSSFLSNGYPGGLDISSVGSTGSTISFQVTLQPSSTHTYYIVPTVENNGSIWPPDTARVSQGGIRTFTMTPGPGYHIGSVVVDGGSVDSSVSYTFHNVTTNHTIRAAFVPDQYTITATTGSNGSISPSGSVLVNTGTDQKFTMTAASNYHVDSVIVDGAKVDSSGSYSFHNVTSGHTIRVTFAINRYAITASAGSNGSISPSGSVLVNHGADQKFTMTAASNYHVDSVIVDGVKVDSSSSYTFHNVTANHTIRATFAWTIVTSTISGNLWYYHQKKPLVGDTVHFRGTNPSCALYTLSNPAFILEDLPRNSTDTLQPYRISGGFPQPGTITSGDALKTFRGRPGGPVPLVLGYELLAADVNGDGVITSGDALAILKRATGSFTDFRQFGLDDWRYVDSSFTINETNWYTSPPARFYSPLTQDHDHQSFIGIIRGDVDGGFGTTGGPTLAKNPDIKEILPDTSMLAPVIFSVPSDLAGNPGDTVSIPLIIDPNGNAVGSFDATMSFDTAVVIYTGNYTIGPIVPVIRGWATDVYGSNNTGTITMAGVDLSGATDSLAGSGAAFLLQFVVNPLSQAGDSAVLPLSALAATDLTAQPLEVAGGSGKHTVLPVQLASFSASVVSGSVRLEWITISEVNGYGFTIERRRGDEILFEELPNSFIAGNGTTTEPHEYFWIDERVGLGVYTYRLRQMDLDGTYAYSHTIEVAVDEVLAVGRRSGIPESFVLFDAYPNPFNPATTIEFGVPVRSFIRLDVYNTIGQLVVPLLAREVEPGYHAIQWRADQGTGMFFYRITAYGLDETGKSFSAAKKLLLMK